MTSSKLVLTRDVLDHLLAHAREGVDPPREVCGVMVGEEDRVTSLRRVPNVADAPRTRYELDPVATMEAIDDAEEAGHAVVGFYHSHPESAPVPSAVDRTRATWPGYVYAIVSPRADAIRAWRWTGDAFDPLDVQFA